MSCSALIRSAPWICTRWLRERLAETLAPVGPQGPPARRCARLVAVAPRARGSLLWTTGTSCVSANLSTMSPNTCPPSLQPLHRRPGGESRVRGAAAPVRGLAHLTLSSLRDGPLPLPPEGRRGVLARISAGENPPTELRLSAFVGDDGSIWSETALAAPVWQNLVRNCSLRRDELPIIGGENERCGHHAAAHVGR
jgi:hypothetical protein